MERFGPMFASEIRKRRVHHRSFSHWRWHLDEVFVRINGETHYLWRAVDHEGEVLEVFAGVALGSQGCVEVFEAYDEALRPSAPGEGEKKAGGGGSRVRTRLRRYSLITPYLQGKNTK